MIQLLGALVLLFVFYCLCIATLSSPQPINGIYSSSGPLYHLKYCLFSGLLLLQRLAGKTRQKREQNEFKNMDRPQKFPENNPQHGNDSIFFIGSCVKTGLTFIVSTERRPNLVTYGLVYIMTPKGDLWRGNWLPYSRLIREKDESFSGGGINVHPVEFMRSWKIDFAGTVKNVSTLEEKKAKIDVTWQSDEPVLLFDEAFPIGATAKAFAKEPWNRQFFDDLKKAHQKHYEQIGHARGNIHLENEEDVFLDNVPTFRDHSFGSRDWKLMHRYIFHIILLSDGTKMLAMAICQPHTCTQLELGYVSSKSGIVSFMDETDLKLTDHGEGGKPSQDYAFNLTADGHEYHIQVKARALAAHYLGEDCEAKNIELFANFNVNGIPGYGIVEWNYRNCNKE